MAPLGAAAGMLGSMIGLGGGVVVVPALTLMGFPPQLAASNSLFAAFGNAAASAVSYSRQRRIEYAAGARLGLLSVPGTVLGALLSADVTPGAFRIVFACVLAASGAYILLRRGMRPPGWAAARAAPVLAVGASFFAGVVSSFFGVGGGIVFVPLMVAAMGMSMARAAPTSQFALLFASLAGMAAHSALGHPDLAQAGYLAAGAFAGALAGARISARAGEGRLRVLAAAALFAVAAKMALDSAAPEGAAGAAS